MLVNLWIEVNTHPSRGPPFSRDARWLDIIVGRITDNQVCAGPETPISNTSCAWILVVLTAGRGRLEHFCLFKLPIRVCTIRIHGALEAPTESRSGCTFTDGDWTYTVWCQFALSRADYSHATQLFYWTTQPTSLSRSRLTRSTQTKIQTPDQDPKTTRSRLRSKNIHEIKYIQKLPTGIEACDAKVRTARDGLAIGCWGQCCLLAFCRLQGSFILIQCPCINASFEFIKGP